MRSTLLRRSTAVGVSIFLAGATAHAQTRPPAPVQWNVGFTSFYEYDTNPLRFSLGNGDSHWRLFPSLDVEAPINPRTTLFVRSAVRRDQYRATSLLNGLGVNGSIGIARRIGPRVSVWGGYDLSLSDQPDVLQISPLRFASYAQQGGSAGLVWRMRPRDVLRADGSAVRRQYRGLTSPQLPSSSSQIDPVWGLGGSWTHTFDGERAAWTRMALNMTWHQSNNPAYSYALPVVSGAWGANIGRQSTLRLDGTLAWLRYDVRRVGPSSVLRRDTIYELAAAVAWRRDRRVQPFVRVGQQWARSTDPLRSFSDTRVLAGARFNLWAGGQRRVTRGRDDARAQIDLSYAHIKAGRWAEAAEAANAAITLDSASAIAWANVGVARYKLGDVAGARKALERSLALNPQNDQLRSLLARMPVIR